MEDFTTSSWHIPWKDMHLFLCRFFGNIPPSDIVSDDFFHVLDREPDEHDTAGIAKKERKMIDMVQHMKNNISNKKSPIVFALNHVHFFIREDTWYNYPSRLVENLGKKYPFFIPGEREVRSKFTEGKAELYHLRKFNYFDSGKEHETECEKKYVPEVNTDEFKNMIGKGLWDVHWRQVGAPDYDKSKCYYHWLPRDFFGGEEVHITAGEFKVGASDLWHVLTKLKAILQQSIGRANNGDLMGSFMATIDSTEVQRTQEDPTMGSFDSPYVFSSYFMMMVNQAYRIQRADEIAKEDLVLLCMMQIKYNSIGTFVTPKTGENEKVYASFFGHEEEVKLYAKYRRESWTSDEIIFEEVDGHIVFNGVMKNKFISLVEPKKTKLIPVCEYDSTGNIIYHRRRNRDALTTKQMVHLSANDRQSATFSASLLDTFSRIDDSTAVPMSIPVEDTTISSTSANDMKNMNGGAGIHEMLPGAPYSKKVWDSFNEYYAYYSMKHPRFSLITDESDKVEKEVSDRNVFQDFLFSVSDDEDAEYEDSQYHDPHWNVPTTVPKRDKQTDREYYMLQKATEINSDVEQYIHVEELLIKEVEYPLESFSGVMTLTFCTICSVTDLLKLQKVLHKYIARTKAHEYLTKVIDDLEAQFDQIEAHLSNEDKMSPTYIANLKNTVRGMTCTTFPILVVLGVTVKFPAVFATNILRHIERTSPH